MAQLPAGAQQGPFPQQPWTEARRLDEFDLMSHKTKASQHVGPGLQPSLGHAKGGHKECGWGSPRAQILNSALKGSFTMTKRA